MIALFFVLTCTLFGQDISSGRIYAAEGDDFVILRDSRRILYNADRVNEDPIAIMPGDIFQTGQQSSADIQFGNNGPFLKIVENSNIGFVGQGNGQTSLALNLYYGRIRIKNGDGGPTVHVSSQNGLVEVKHGDTGIDYIVRNDLITLHSDASVALPVLYVTNFEGETNVFPANSGNAVSVLPQLIVREGETVSVEFISSLSYVERNAQESASADYWRIYDFAPVPVSPSAIVEAPHSAVESPSQDDLTTADTVPSNSASAEKASSPDDGTAVSSNIEEIPFSIPDVRPEYEALARRKNSAFIASLIFFTGGLILEGVGMYYHYGGDADKGYFYTISGALVAGAGVASLIHGFTIKLE